MLSVAQLAGYGLLMVAIGLWLGRSFWYWHRYDLGRLDGFNGGRQSLIRQKELIWTEEVIVRRPDGDGHFSPERPALPWRRERTEVFPPFLTDPRPAP